mmetsp:Transcript_11638/g.17066  ORF Transcript_11638/g.17066 Transcript_11638/m.17066 type:complete len:157 (-) Transcript_11638:2483-2953(-)
MMGTDLECFLVLENCLETYAELLRIGVTNVDTCLGDKFAFHIACEQGHLEFLEFLVLKGSDLSLEDCYGRKPFMVAVEFAQLECLELLCQYNAPPGNFFGAFKKSRNKPLVKGILLSLIQKINWQERQGFIFWCAKKKPSLRSSLLREVVKYLGYS